MTVEIHGIIINILVLMMVLDSRLIQKPAEMDNIVMLMQLMAENIKLGDLKQILFRMVRLLLQ